MYTVQRVGQEIRRVRTRMGISQKEIRSNDWKEREPGWNV